MTPTSPSKAVATMADIVEAYADAGNPMEVPAIEIAAWAVNQDLYDIPFEDKIKRCAKDLADAMGKATIVDASGNKVRKYLSAKMLYNDGASKVQRDLWDRSESCSEHFAHNATRRMRKGILADCKSLASTIAYMNENNPNLASNQIDMSFDFTGELDGS